MDFKFYFFSILKVARGCFELNELMIRCAPWKMIFFYTVARVSRTEPCNRCRTLMQHTMVSTTMAMKPIIAKTMPVVRPGLL